jgi:formate-dependent nitrite reductase membrane component NrfD
MGILEVQNIVGVAMAIQVKVLLNPFGLINKIITYVKDEGSNLATLTSILAFVVFCFPLQLPCPFVGFCFGHAMSKVTQYAIDDVKMCFGFIQVNLKGS